MRETGARFIAEILKAYNVTHVLYVEAMLRRSLVEMEELGIKEDIDTWRKGIGIHG